MKKPICLVLVAALVAALFAVPAFAASEQINVLMTTPGVTVTPAAKYIDAEELAEAIEAALEPADEEDTPLIPEACKLDPERITVLQSGTFTTDWDQYYVTFKVWSTVKRTIALFFMPEDGEAWELVSCNLGDVLEGGFQSSGSYAIVVGW